LDVEEMFTVPGHAWVERTRFGSGGKEASGGGAKHI
jgi:hypothetical protein